MVSLLDRLSLPIINTDNANIDSQVDNADIDSQADNADIDSQEDNTDVNTDVNVNVDTS
jgi:hypothetical protein